MNQDDQIADGAERTLCFSPMLKAAGDKTGLLGMDGESEQCKREQDNTEEEDNEELAEGLVGFEWAEEVHIILSFPRKRESRFSSEFNESGFPPSRE